MCGPSAVLLALVWKMIPFNHRRLQARIDHRRQQKQALYQSFAEPEAPRAPRGPTLPSLRQVMASRFVSRAPSGAGGGMQRTASKARPSFHRRIAAMRVDSAQEVAEAGLKPIGSALYKCAHAIWELRGEGDGLVLVRKQEERLPDFMG